MERRSIWSITSILILSLVPVSAWAGREKLDAALKARVDAKSTANVRVIIQLPRPPRPARIPFGWQQGDSQAVSALQGRIRQLRGRDLGTLYGLRCVVAELPVPALLALSDDPRCARISFNWPVVRHMDQARVALGMNTVQSTYPGLDGTGVGVAIIDSGCYPHEDLKNASGQSRIIAFKDFVNNQTAPYDDNGHGTHVAGICAGNGKMSNVSGSTRIFKGIAPNANLVIVKVLDQYCSGATSRIMEGLQWCVTNKSLYNIRVINMSLGHAPGESYLTDPLCLAVRQCIDAGIFVACSAGNRGWGGYGSVSSPGTSPDACTVGAMKYQNLSGRSNHTYAYFSSRGPSVPDRILKPDIVTHGNRIVALRSPNSYLDNLYYFNRVAPSAYGAPTTDPTSYFLLSGTSMASPSVAGAAALMVQQDPGITPATIKWRLMRSAEKVNMEIYRRGCGYLDIPSALASTEVATAAPSAAVILNADGTITLSSETVSWSELLTCLGVNYAWGENNCAGENFPWSSEGLAGENFAAGETEVTGYGEN